MRVKQTETASRQPNRLLDVGIDLVDKLGDALQLTSNALHGTRAIKDTLHVCLPHAIVGCLHRHAVA